MQAIQGELDAVREQSREAENVLRRATINAPVSGTVVRTYYHTTGGVIESGKGILEILPAGVPLIIEAQVPRNAIDRLRVGQAATIRLVALNQRTTPVLEGKRILRFRRRAAGEQDGDRSNNDIYVIRVNLDAGEMTKAQRVQPDAGHAGRGDDPDRGAHLLQLHRQADHRQHVESLHRALRAGLAAVAAEIRGANSTASKFDRSAVNG